MISGPDEKISHFDPVNKAMSFPESSQGLIARQNKFFKTFLPFNFIKCLTFNNISWWQKMSAALRALSWDMMQDIKRNLDGNVAISLEVAV